MWFGVLGPLLAIENSKSLELGGPKQRTVLAVLLASEGERVSADLLVEAVYGEGAHDRARRTIQTYVSNLRRTLGDVIAAETGGWRLDLAEHQFDAREFEERYRSATQSDLDPRERVELLDSVLEVWRGEPYEQVEAHGMLESEAARLSELKLGAEAARIDAALAIGLHAEVVANTESLLAQFPYDERLRAQHMLGLYRSGRQQDALASYAHMRERLAQELGINPSPQLQELEQRILEQHPSLDLPTPRSEASAAKSADVEPKHNLPAELTEFRVDLVERDPVLEHLGILLADARQGSGRVVVLRGEAGIGKTSVVKAFCDANGEEVHVLWGACDDLLTPQPLGPIWDMTFEEPQLEELLLDDSRQRVFGALYELLTRSLRPTVMVIEDVHWADESTTDLIRYLGRRIDQTHGLLILTYRDDAAGWGHPIQFALGNLPRRATEQIALQPLSVETVAHLAGDEWDADELWNLTDGNPFFVTELLAAGPLDVPVSIRDAMKSRVLRLSDRGRELVELASIAPGRIELSMVEEIMLGAVAAIEEAERVGLLEVRGHYLSFRHELARRAVQEDLPEIRKRHLNLEMLRACEAMRGDVARCAHFAREAGDANAILRLLPQAARRAADLESHREAVSHLRILEPFLDEMNREELSEHYDLWAWEEHLVESSREEIIDRAIELRRKLGAPEALGSTLLMASRIAWTNLKREAAIGYAEQAADVLEEVGGDNLAMAYSTLSQLAMLGGDETRTIDYGERALEIIGDQPSRVQVHAQNNIGSVRMMNHYPEGASELEQSYRLSGELGLAHDQSRAALNLAVAHLWGYEVDEASSWLERGKKIAEDNDIITFISFASAVAAIREEMKGDWETAEAKAQEVIEGHPVQEHSKTLAMFALARVNVRRGSPDAKQSALQAWEKASQSGELPRVGPAGAVLAEYLWLGGELDSGLHDDLRQLIQSATELGTGWISDVGIWLSLKDLIDEAPGDVREPFSWLDSGDWRAAADFWEERGTPYEHAVALSFGDELARLRALEILDDLGALPLAARLRAELRSEGVEGIPRGPRQVTRENPLGLTPRQTEVLQLVAEDLTNAEIADRLYVSSRTVDHHVSAILDKLGVDDRFDAVDKAREAGLVE